MMTLFLIIWPLILALGIFMFRPSYAKWLAFIGSVVEFAAALVIMFQFNRSGGFDFALNVPWIPTLGISFSVGIDGISLLLVLLTTGLIPLIILSSASSSNEKPANFYGLILVMQMALVGVFTALDGFLFYVFWEMALIPIYFICLIWGGENRSFITLKFFIYTLTGSLFMLVALLYLYYQTPGDHSFHVDAIYAAVVRFLRPTRHSFLGLVSCIRYQDACVPLSQRGKPIPIRWHLWKHDAFVGNHVKDGFLWIDTLANPYVPLGVSEWAFTAIVLLSWE